MAEEPRAVSEVRAWRAELAEEWADMSWNDIIAQLNSTGRRFREKTETEQVRLNQPQPQQDMDSASQPGSGSPQA